MLDKPTNMQYNVAKYFALHISEQEVIGLIPSQMLKGTLEGCILKIITNQETYGYEISQQLQQFGFSNISEGTIYPLLLRLEKNGYITAEYRESSLGPRRKYFSIAPAGEKELSEFYKSWRELEDAVNHLFLNGGKAYEQADKRTAQS